MRKYIYLFTYRALLNFMCLFLISCGNSSNVSYDDTLNRMAKPVEANYIKYPDEQKPLPLWSKQNVVLYHVNDEPDGMHPTNSNSIMAKEIMCYTQVYLIGTDYRKSMSRPFAIKTLPIASKNGKEYFYELRDDIKFDDGQIISVEDVIFTFKAVKCPLTNTPHFKPYLDNLIDIVIDKKNPRAFRMIMKSQYILNTYLAAMFPIMQRSFFDKKNILSKYTFKQFDDKDFKADQKDLNEWATEFNSSKYNRNPEFIVGAGPYYFEKWDTGQLIILRKKKNHWSKQSSSIYEKSYPDEIIFKINKDPNSQLLEFKSQTIDASTSLSSSTLIALQSDKKFNVNYNSCFMNTFNYNYVAMNMRPDGIKHKKIFDDKKVRRAMAMLFPLDNINKIIYKDKNKRITGPVSSLRPEYDNTQQLIPFDIEHAKLLLDEAGWKDTDGDNIRDKIVDDKKTKLEFQMDCYVSNLDFVKLTAEQMYKAGVKVIINPLNFSVLYENARNHNFDMLLGGWSKGYGPEDYTQVWHTSSWLSNGLNYPGFGNPESDALIDSIKYTLDDAKRIPMVKRLQEMIYDEQPYIFLFTKPRQNVIHKRFGNQEIYSETPGVLLSNLQLLNTTVSLNAEFH